MVRLESEQPRKQRKARYNAPNHIRSRFLTAPLDKGLKEQYKKKSIRVVTGDTVKVLRGNHAGHEGNVDGVDMKHLKLIIHGVSVKKADGTEVPRPVDPSNVQVTKLNLEDSRREKKLSGA